MRSCLALFVFLFVFLPLAFCGLLTASVSSWLLDRNFYTDLFSAEEIYSALLSGNLDLENSLELGSTELDPAVTRAFGQAILEAVSPSYVRDEVLRNINAVFDYLEDTSRGLTLTWDLRPLKRGLSAEQIDTFADVLIKNLPPCSPRTPQADLILPTCLPTDKSAQQLTAEVRQNLPRFVERLPDFQTIGEPIPPNTQGGALLGDLAQTAVSSGALSLLTGTFFAWLFIGALAARSTKGLWTTLGITLLVPALPVLLLGILLLTGTADGIFSANLNTAFAEIGLQDSAALDSVLRRAFSRISGGFLTYGGGATGIAVLLLVIGALMPQPRKRKPKDGDINLSDYGTLR
jgi:hypothetical protein